MNLVGTERDQVCSERSRLYRELHIALNAVAMCDNFGVTALYSHKSLSHGHNISGLVVDEHHAHKAGILIAGGNKIVRIKPSVIARRDPHYFKSVLFKSRSSLVYGRVLNR